MKKKLVFYITTPNRPHLETELEIIDNHLMDGYDVVVISCMGALCTCLLNQKHDFLKCKSCNSRLKSGIKWLNSDKVLLKKLFWITDEQKREIEKIENKNFQSWDELRTIKVDNDDIGDAAFSELITLKRDINPEFNQNNVLLARKLLKNALITHYSIFNHIKFEKPNKFILFNGRMSPFRPALRIAQSLEIETYVYEFSFKVNHYILIKNNYPHNPFTLQESIVNAFKNSKIGEEEKFDIASRWYSERENQTATDQRLFTLGQKKGQNINFLKKNSNLLIGIFISSEDELFAIPEYKSPFYLNQNEGIKRIIDDLKAENLKFVIRAHPNLKGLKNSQTMELEDFCRRSDKVVYLSPESEINTYNLIELVDIVLVFGSTVGIESVNKEKFTILMGNATYKGLGGTTEPNSHEELINLLKEFAQDKNGSIKKYKPSPKTMKNAAMIYAFGLNELCIEKKYQKLKHFNEYSWIEKNNVRSYIKPNSLFTLFTNFITIMSSLKMRIGMRIS